MKNLDRQTQEHVPAGLRCQEMYPELSESDERHFRVHLPELTYYEKDLAAARRNIGNDHIFKTGFDIDVNRVLPGLIKALGRAPTPAEIMRERDRQKIIEKQVLIDEFYDPMPYQKAEVQPQRQVIEARALDFPADPAEWESAPAEIKSVEVETRKGVKSIEEQLIITTSNQRGGKTEHPVMTTAELKWVKDSADVIADHAGKDGKVFIGGLGLGLLNRELDARGVGTQVVGEINTNVIDIVEPKLQKDMKGKLEVRQGDFRETLRKAIEAGEQFDAISIDAFPNTAEEVNRDASSTEVLKLALKALKPGGILTFYPDSRYLPMRVLETLHHEGIPKSCIHYTVSEFEQSDFTERYHYGNLMAVPCVMKPLITDRERIAELEKEYEIEEGGYLDAYSEKYQRLDQAEAA